MHRAIPQKNPQSYFTKKAHKAIPQKKNTKLFDKKPHKAISRKKNKNKIRIEADALAV